MTAASVGVAPAAGCNCAVCPFFTANPAAVEPVCSGCNTDCSYCGCARAEADAPRGGCVTCPIRCGSRIDIGAWMEDVGRTVAFDDIVLLQAAWPPGLPRFVPMVDAAGAVGELDSSLHWPAYGIGLRRVFSPVSGRILPGFRGVTAHEAMGLKPEQLAVLVGYGTDPLVEAFWTRRRTEGLVEAIASQQWDLVLAPNYSVYGNQPRAEHLLNFRRNLLVAAELAQAGVPAVPNLYWFRLEDLDRYAGWMADTAPGAVAVNCQTFRSETDWDSMLLPGLVYLAAVLDDLGAGTRVVLTGVSRADRLRAASAAFGERLHVVSQNPVQYARHGAVMTAEGRRDIHAEAADAFAASVRYYASLLPGGRNPS